MYLTATELIKYACILGLVSFFAGMVVMGFMAESVMKKRGKL